jgi:hypothetical protein
MTEVVEDPRGVSNREIQGRGTGAVAGNPGTLLGTETVDGLSYARYRAEPGTWVSASLKQAGYDHVYGKDAGYGAYAGVPRATDGSPLTTPDRIRPGQEYLIPARPNSPASRVNPSGVPLPDSRAAQPDSRAIQEGVGDRATGIDRAFAGGPGGGVLSAALLGPASVLSDGPLSFVPAAGEAGDALAGAAAKWGSAELITGGGGAATSPWAWALPAAATAAAVGWAVFEWYKYYRAGQSLQQAKASSADLRRQLDQAVRTAWQNGFITIEEYLLYIATGNLVIQPRDSAGGAASSSPKGKVAVLFERPTAGSGSAGRTAPRFVNGDFFMRSASAHEGVERASPQLIEAIIARRTVTFATPGSEEMRYLESIGAEANVGGEELTHIILRQDPSKAAIIEEFLHGTQKRLGIVNRLGHAGMGSAETHVKTFMIRHQYLLGLSQEDVTILQKLRDAGL